MTNQTKTTPQTIESYIRVQSMTAAIINAIVNPALAWLMNQKIAPVSLWQGSSIAMDTIITSIILSLLVAHFSASGTGSALKSGQMEIKPDMAEQNRFIRYLPKKPWQTGLLFSFCNMLILLPLLTAIFNIAGIITIPFSVFAIYKSIFTATLAYITASCTIKKELAKVSQSK
ncbi:MAG: hypothetical protein LWY06_09200 [Firmicutes bacterium]|nr:hypothetical protein [Bacillota bacterium]